LKRTQDQHLFKQQTAQPSMAASLLQTKGNNNNLLHFIYHSSGYSKRFT